MIADVAVDSRDFGGPVYALTDDNGAVIVGLFEGMWGSAPEMESWQAVMQQVYIDGRAQNQQQQPPGEARMIGRRVTAPVRLAAHGVFVAAAGHRPAAHGAGVVAAMEFRGGPGRPHRRLSP